MDILTHICSGIAGATVVVPFAAGQLTKQWQILAVGAVGGAFPDVDAISMWSRFDVTFGRLFRLNHSRQVIYGEKFWYSHHAFFHSIMASLLIAAVFGLLAYSIYRLKYKTTFFLFCKKNIFIGIAFIAGYILHLLGDMPTPASVWSGINFFWPNDNYIGGSGKIWWWNNYDIFLLIVLCIIINCILLFTFKSKRRIQRIMIILVSVFTILLIEIQINNRKYDYSYNGNASHYAEMERHSKEEQKRILGKPLYSAMEYLDRHLPFYF